ncbi:hypothetical protein QFC22_005528 [Naganishia vaughanmartiniae]|uniref:Uncharacterized protein n=1 Tax=Naganishia vaughanmartiniae TaxID=1424756 RepID=A0ACC2WSP0_9TREE|nr:hypothetical protein QFC22_005528 [Naganishia vaughanmartiniae]
MTVRTSARKAATATTIVSSIPPPTASVTVSSGMTRRSKRVVESESPEAQEVADGTENIEQVGEEGFDAEGEIDPDDDEDAEGEDMDIDEEYRVEEPSVTPAETPTPTATVAPSNTSGIKIKLTLNKSKQASSSSSTTTNAEAGPSNARTGTRSKRTAAQAKADAAFEDDTSQASVNTSKGKSHKKKVKLEAAEKGEVSDAEETMGGLDPLRMTARQRAKQGAGGFGEHLMMLPEGKASRTSYLSSDPMLIVYIYNVCFQLVTDSGKKIILSDLEKQRKKEENARRRKLQMDQKMENDRNDVINRLLKAQTGKTRRNVAQMEGTPMSGLDGEETINGTATDGSAISPAVPGMLRFVSSIRSGNFVMSVSAPPGKEETLQFEESLYHSRAQPAAERVAEKRTSVCALSGCSKPIKYRYTSNFNLGGCSLDHYRSVKPEQNKPVT